MATHFNTLLPLMDPLLFQLMHQNGADMKVESSMVAIMLKTLTLTTLSFLLDMDQMKLTETSG